MNVFLIFSSGIIILILLFIGFSQTHTFREYLREKIISDINSSINGKLYIEGLDGTILTSIFLRNTSLTVGNDTIFFSDKIEVKASPLQLLLRKIYFRKIEIENARVALREDKKGIWNLSMLMKQAADEVQPESISESEDTGFNFSIQVNELALKNIDFILQKSEHFNSQDNYETINTDDLRVKNINLDASLLADIRDNNYTLIIKNCSFEPNLKKFKLRELSGKFELAKDYAAVNNLYALSDSSEIRLSARLDQINLFGGLNLTDFKDYPVTLDLDTTPFNFDDLTSFLNATNILKGRPEVHLTATGKFGDFQIEKLNVAYSGSEFNIIGRMRELHTPEKLFIDALIENSSANFSDVIRLLPGLGLPEFDQLQLTNLNAQYSGQPTKFTASVEGNLTNGLIKSTCSMDLQSEPIQYNISFETTQADLSPILGINTNINSYGLIKGQGTNPNDLDADFIFKTTNSSLNGYDLDSLTTHIKAKSKKINLNSAALINGSYSALKGNINFTDEIIPIYNLSGIINNLNLGSFLNNPQLISSLNFEFNIDGKYFNLDSMIGSCSIDLKNSTFSNKHIDDTKLKLAIESADNLRTISFNSDIANVIIEGNYSIIDVLNLLSYESSVISDVIKQKMVELNPLYVFEDSTHTMNNVSVLPDFINNNLEFDYKFSFKDLKLISILFDIDKFEILGNSKGKVINDSTNFSISSNISLNYILTSDKGNTLYISDLNTDLNLTRDNRVLGFDNLFGTLSISGEKIYSVTEINNLYADLIFNENKLYLNAYAEMSNSLKTELEGNLSMSSMEQKIILNKLWFEYKGVEWENKSPIYILFTPEYLKVDKFLLAHDKSELDIEGDIIKNGDQNLTLNVKNLDGNLLTNYFMNLESPYFSANINLTSKINGTFQNPNIHVDLEVNQIKYGSVDLGHLICESNYQDKKISTNLVFLDSTFNTNSPNLTINSIFPIDLSFENVQNRLINDKQISAKITAEKFDLRSLGDILPGISNQSGYLSTDIEINGTYSNLDRSGHLIISDGSFRTIVNNLYYNYEMSLRFDLSDLIVDKVIISNSHGSKYPGTLYGRGIINFDGFDINNIDLSVNGNIALLGKNSSIVSPSFFGDLLVATDGNLIFSYKNRKPFFKGVLLLKETNLTYVSEEALGGYSNNDFIYNILIDSTKIERKELEFQKALSAHSRNNAVESDFAKNFNSEIDIKIINDAKLEFILSKAANQKLIVEARGDLKFESGEGISNVQGEINLLPGSKLEFIKTFEADGKIRFETDITDPFLDIIATYLGGYDLAEVSGKTQDVAVKIKLQGPLSELGRNLANNPDNIGVYIGTRNIENNISDKRYDVSDAFSFIFVGKFKEDLTTTDRNQVASQTAALNNTAASFLGSVLTSFVNSAVGDVINNIQLSQSGEYTKFSVSGKLENIRYKFGGTTEVFQDINKANIKLEYLFNPNFLIRLERKDPILRSFGIDEKISELGLKYRFEF